MKTLIFNGSPRSHGDTSRMIEALRPMLPGEIKVIKLYKEEIRPCVDCRACSKQAGCVIQDSMQDVYKEIEECDHIILASPIYFEELTGVLLAALSRLQTYYSARYIRRVEPILKKKTGGIILTAGSIGPKEKPEGTARMLLGAMGCKSLYTVYVGHTDRVSAMEQKDTMEQLKKLAECISEAEKTRA
ncbi:MAG: flavodoxin family protein [Eubacteriales bacterium]|nr:flavodoxin family protein [Eubacteriales bacterium]